jgi:hypothetical protein
LRIPALTPVGGLSLRRFVLLLLVLVAVAGTIYGATSGARRAIGPAETQHARAVAPPAIPAPVQHASSVR